MKNLKMFGLIFLILFAGVTFAATPDEFEGIAPQIDVQTNIYELPTDALSSAIAPLSITNPYAAAGIPVVVDFTLSNIGQEYPFNQIPLPPDSYALIMTVDKDLGVVICNEKNADGSCRFADTYDVWADMSGFEQVVYAMGMGVSQLVETVGGEVTGKTCRYVDVYAALPVGVQERIKVFNDGKPPDAVYTWDCLDIVDEPFFNQQVRSYCQNQITTACISELNREIGKQAVASTVPVLLSSHVPKGQCIRPAFEHAKAGDLIAVFGDAITASDNLVVCGIGTNGLNPNESVTFRFIVLVPADAPVVPIEEIPNLTELNEGVTMSPSCVGSDFPLNCHSIYAAVAPVNAETLLTHLVKLVGQVPKVAGGVFSAVWNTDPDGLKNYVQTQHNLSVGTPIWRGQGIFYVLGAQLQGEIFMLLWAAAASGLIMSGVRRKTGVGK